MTTENCSFLNKKKDSSSSLWKKKYILLLKRAENVEKQNVRLINRLCNIKRITKRLDKERKFLVKRLDGYNDDFRCTKFFLEAEMLPEGTVEVPAKLCDQSLPETIDKSHVKLGLPPKKPMSAFFRYCQSQHLKFMQEKRNLSHDEIKKNLSARWSTLSDSEKEVYLMSYGEEYELYEKEMKDFLHNFKEFVETNSIYCMFNEASSVPENQEIDLNSETKEDVVEGNDNRRSDNNDGDQMNHSLSSCLSEELGTNTSEDETEENG